MKKLYRSNKYIKTNEARQRDREAREQAHKKWKKGRNRSQSGLSKSDQRIRRSFQDYQKVEAPEIFSFINNTNEVSRFVTKLKELYDNDNKVFIVMKNVKEIDYGAIVVLLSIMIKFKAKGINFNGDKPTSLEPRKVLNESGFTNQLNRQFMELDEYNLSRNGHYGIHTHANKKVNSSLTASLIESASLSIWGESRRCPGVQRTLLELMQNTNNHAGEKNPGEKLWWLSVHHDKSRKVISFSFIDFGVGVFESLNNKDSSSKFFDWQTIAEGLGIDDNKKVMKSILSGVLHKTVTGKPYRGKGLPGIAEVLSRNQISNLHIITNNVAADVSNGKYSTVKPSFSGTYIYFELGDENESIKYN